MTLADAIGKEDRLQIKESNYRELVAKATQFEMLMNGLRCGVPYVYIREMMTGEPEGPVMDEYGIIRYRQRRKR